MHKKRVLVEQKKARGQSTEKLKAGISVTFTYSWYQSEWKIKVDVKITQKLNLSKSATYLKKYFCTYRFG